MQAIAIVYNFKASHCQMSAFDKRAGRSASVYSCAHNDRVPAVAFSCKGYELDKQIQCSREGYTHRFQSWRKGIR